MTRLELDTNPTETLERKKAIEDIIGRDGSDRAHYLLERTDGEALAAGAHR